MFPLQKITILFLRKPNNSFVQIQVNLQGLAAHTPIFFVTNYFVSFTKPCLDEGEWLAVKSIYRTAKLRFKRIIDATLFFTLFCL